MAESGTLPPPMPATEEEAVRAHIDWLWQVNRILIEGLEVDEALVAPHAHRLCAFHRWLTRNLAEATEDQARARHLARIDQLHHQVHALARDMLNRYRHDQPYDDVYAAFSKVVVDFNALLARHGRGA